MDSKVVLMDIGKKIFHLRREKSWNQEQLGKKLGIRGKEVSRIERGRRTPAPSLLEEIVKIFGVSRDYLFDPNRDYYPPRPPDRLNSKAPSPPSPPLEQRIEIIRETEEEFIVRIKKRC